MIQYKSPITESLSRLMAAASVIVAAALAFITCQPEVELREEEEKVQLATPSPVLGEIGSTWAELTWEKVEGALAYYVYFDGDEHPVMSITSGITLQNLEQSTSYTVCVTAVPSSRSRWYTSDPSQAITFTTDSKPSIGTPDISISDLTTMSFIARWNTIGMAESYLFSFDGSEPQSITDTVLTIGGDMSDIPAALIPGGTYILKVRAIPQAAYAEDWNESPWAEKAVTMAVPDTLAAPEWTLERESCIRTIISWDAVEGASGYEWIMDADPSGVNDTIRTTALSIKLEGLERDSHHSIRIRAISADTQKVLDSDWTEITFTALYDFMSSLKIMNASATDRQVSFDATVSQAGEYFTAGIVPEALYMKDDLSGIDSAAVMAKIEADLAAAIAEKTGAGKTEREARGEILYGKTESIVLDGLYEETSYICYALGVETDGTYTSGLLLDVLKTGVQDRTAPEGASFSHGAAFAEGTASQQFSWSTSSGFLRPTSSVIFNLKRTDASKTLKTLKYALLKLSDYDSKIGTRGEAGAGALAAYLAKSGSEFTSANYTSVNGGTTVGKIYTKMADDTFYMAVMMAITTEADTLVSADCFKTYREGASWAEVSGTTDGKFTLTSGMPVKEGQYKLVGLSSSNNRPEILRAYFDGLATTNLVESRITTLNTTGSFTFSYNGQLTSGSNYHFIIRLTNRAGDVTYANTVVKAE